MNRMCDTQCIAGIYERMDTEEIQEGLKQMPFFIAYEACPSDSGKIHSSVKSRFLNNDPVVLAAVEQWKKLTDDSKVAIKTGDVNEFRKLMDQNFVTLMQPHLFRLIKNMRTLMMKKLRHTIFCITPLPSTS